MSQHQNTLQYLFVLLAASSVVAVFENTEKLSLIFLLVFAVAETGRQYLFQIRSPAKAKSKKLFFFGVLYNDENGFFTEQKNKSEITEITQLFKFGYAVLAVFSVYGFFAPNSTTVFSIFLFIMALLWLQIKNSSQFRELLYFLGFQTAMQFSMGHSSKNYFLFFWMILFFYVLHQSFSGEDFSQMKAKFRNSLVLVVVIMVCYKFFDFLTPIYGANKSVTSLTAGASDQSAQPDGFRVQNESRAGSQNSTKGNNGYGLNLYQSVARSISAAKLMAEAIKKINLKDLGATEEKTEKLNLSFIKKLQSKAGTRIRSYGKNADALENYKKSLENGRQLSAEDFKKLKQLADKIHLEESQLNETSTQTRNDPKQIGKNNINDSEESKKIDELVGAIGANDTNAKATTSDEDMAKYLDSRKQLARQVEQLIQRDRRNTLLSEQLKLEKLFVGAVENLKKFGLLVGFILILTFWFSRKKQGEKTTKSDQVKNVALPAEVRKTLRQLYWQILNSKMTANEEVIRSFHVVELAFAKIEYNRDESQPPTHYFETLNKKIPYFAEHAEFPIKIFNKVFYGSKTPNVEDMKLLRNDLKMLLSRFKVI
jgi:hypothetical protein